MSRREELDTNDLHSEQARPTRTPSERNVHELRCRECGDTYFVDDAEFERVSAALQFDPTDNPFVCDRCEEEYEIEERR